MFFILATIKNAGQLFRTLTFLDLNRFSQVWRDGQWRIPGKISGTALFEPSLSSLGRGASACSTLEKSREGESVKKNGPERAESVSGSYSNFFDQSRCASP